ncbi:rhodanese-like domain-containing protein [Alteromonas lipotrueiana]|uniref:rhodanese-like domain-containing protein n=1 Tax=Alteromonas lipotrueiana TaxID=2803815 RepID=UPI001C45496E|nr:rhodanese-like domain-containing protein [Alteromonas lipotrueiana]
MLSFTNYLTDIKKQINELSVQEVFCRQGNLPLLIDIREPQEWQAGILPTAICCARGLLESRIETLMSDFISPDPDVILYCRSGARSALAAYSLSQMQFSRVYSMAGGITAWQEQGYPLSKLLPAQKTE